MKHYYFIKVCKSLISKVYECWCDYDTALNFKKSLEIQYNCYFTLCEVVN